MPMGLNYENNTCAQLVLAGQINVNLEKHASVLSPRRLN
jgi:hypothetical protein